MSIRVPSLLLLCNGIFAAIAAHILDSFISSIDTKSPTAIGEASYLDIDSIEASTHYCNETLNLLLRDQECAGIVLSDGYAHICTATGQGYIIDTAAYYRMAVAVYSPTNGIIRSLAYYECNRAAEANNSPLQEANLEYKVTFVWPKDKSVITSDTLELYFHFQLPSHTSDSEPSQAETVICFEFEKLNSAIISNQPNSFSYICTNSMGENMIEARNLTSGVYVARAWIVGNIKSTSSDLLSSMNANINQMRSYLLTNPSARRRAAGSVNFELKHLATTQPAQAEKSALLPQILGFDFPIPTDVKSYVTDVIAKGSDTAIHVLLMSARSLDRYREAEVMLKSLLFNHRYEEGSGNAARLLVIHIVADKAGVDYFTSLWFKQKLYLIRGVVGILHDFDGVCTENIVQFLSRNNLNISFHHSGIAGYCRLAIPMYFASLERLLRIYDINAEYETSLSVDSIATVLVPKSVICIETDQLVLSDIAELWDYYHEHRDEDDLIAAPENYMPWDRPHSRVVDEQQHQSVLEERADLDIDGSGNHSAGAELMTSFRILNIIMDIMLYTVDILVLVVVSSLNLRLMIIFIH